MRLIKKSFILLALMLCVGVFCFPVYAYDGEPLIIDAILFDDDTENTETTSLIAHAAWIDGDMLRINVTDVNGVHTSLALRLDDYVNGSENKEFIAIQAVDLNGNKSGVIEIKNPYYKPAVIEQNEPKPFTPDGSGTVIDDAYDGDGKEFFTVGTEDGSIFYLIVDRQRDSDNVYLLNAVTEEDLMALAEKNGREINIPNGNAGNVSAIPIPVEPEPPAPPQEDEPVVETPPENTPKKSDNSSYIIIGLIALAAGAIGYYFKIVKGKKDDSDINDEDEDDEDEYGYGDEPDEEDDYKEGDDE